VAAAVETLNELAEAVMMAFGLVILATVLDFDVG
jgi:hypothetical protein